MDLKAPSVLLTFKTHPKIFFNPSGDFKILSSNDEKIEQLKGLNLDALLFMDFDANIAKLHYCEFVKQILVQKLNSKAIVMGYDHHFGRAGAGTYPLVKECAEMINVDVFQVQEHNLGEHLSSSQIRKALCVGDIEQANQFLGYRYGFDAIVVKGKQIGRTIGFPTANLSLVNNKKLMPAMGVYVVQIIVGENRFFGVLNYGLKPTIDLSIDPIAEVFIFNFSQDLYGKKIRIEFLSRLRSELKFSSLAELKGQIERDKLQAELFVSNLGN